MTKCEYCAFDVNGNGKEWKDKDGDFSILVQKKIGQEYFIHTKYEGDSAFIKFCPMCGRKLTDLSALSAIAPNNKFKSYTDDLAETLSAKNKYYGNSFDKTLEKYGLVALAIRLDDKLSRLASLSRGETQQVKDESLKDTLQDIAGYAILGMRYLDHE